MTKPKNDNTVYTYNAEIQKRELANELKDGEVLVKVYAVGFNHRELWIRKGLYPRIQVGAVYGADGAGVVVSSSKAGDELLNKRVFLTPARGWKNSLDGPETQYGILGGCVFPSLGTFSEYVILEREEVIEIPDHLEFEHAAAWPVAAVTAWRAVVMKGQVQSGQNVLITGIGGGVALIVLQICVALGANVYVTSGDEAKIQKAVELGAKGGINYKSEKFPQDLVALLNKKQLDVVIDGAGGDLFKKLGKTLKLGAKVVCYGMTAAPEIKLTMHEVLRNIELKGSTMGSDAELREATAFIAKHRIVPVVSHVLEGLESAEEGFKLLEEGKHFGKVILRICRDSTSRF